MSTAIARCWAAEEAYSSPEFVTWPDYSSLCKKQKLPLLVAPLCKDTLETLTAKGQLLSSSARLFSTLLPVPWHWYHTALQISRCLVFF